MQKRVWQVSGVAVVIFIGVTLTMDAYRFFSTDGLVALGATALLILLLLWAGTDFFNQKGKSNE